MKDIIKKIPMIGPILQSIYRKYIRSPKPFTGSQNYWMERYELSGNSGVGSYGKLAEFKAEIINGFVREKKIKTIIEYGCGDGNQLMFADYPSYMGFDISPRSLLLCRKKFSEDKTKTFRLMDDYTSEKSQLTLSLDVIYHLVEDNIFDKHMQHLFESAENFVIIYSSNTNSNSENRAAHVRHRKFSGWIKKNKPEWKLLRHIPNRYPISESNNAGSFADFYIYERAQKL